MTSAATTPPLVRPVRRLGGLAVRGAVLVLLIAAALPVLARTFPQQVGPARLAEDLRAGQVHRLEPERGESALEDGGPVHWSTGPLTWYATSLPPDWRGAGAGRTSAWPPGTSPEDVLDTLVRESPRRVREWPVPLDVETGILDYWPILLTAFVLTVWLIVFGTMLARHDHRYAGRWAWFWLFTVGQVGILLYLLLETRPLWTASRRLPSREPQRLWSGVAGLAIAVPIGLGILGAGAVLR
ncbi:hypothetical protein [Actinoallomurus sp. CA-150999]|uniref:hypothetical protein n=1 Tax=Actinoallomurus sp. CA-150999 TaxID=3239887 RepID=UPI003D917665